MFRHPQLAGLEKRKWDLLAKSSSLRDDLLIESFYWRKISKWADMGVSVLRLIGVHRHWMIGLFGAVTAWLFRTGTIREAREQIEHAAHEGRNMVSNLLSLGQKALLGWKFFQHAKSMMQGYRAARHPES